MSQTTTLATDKQKAFIRKLIAERPAEAVADLRNELNAQLPLTKAVASDAITRLLAIPRVKAERPKVNLEAIEPGYYVKDDDVYVVVLNKAKTGRYAKRLVVDADTSYAHWDYFRGAIFDLGGLEPLTLEEAARLGHLHGICVVCAKALTDPSSVERGIGPVCAKRLGR